MAIAFDAAAVNDASGITRTLSHTIGSITNGYLIGMAVAYRPGGLPTATATWNGVSMTLLGTHDRPGALLRLYFFGLAAPDTGTHDYVVTFSVTPDFTSQIAAMSYSGVQQTDSTRTFTGATGTGTSAAINVPSDVGDLVVAMEDVDSGTDATPDVSQTVRWTSVIPQKGSDAAGASPTADLSWTWSGSHQYLVGGISLKPAATDAPLLWMIA